MSKVIVISMIILTSAGALAYVGYHNKKAMQTCQEKHSHDYCFRQIMR